MESRNPEPGERQEHQHENVGSHVEVLNCDKKKIRQGMIQHLKLVEELQNEI